MESLEKHGNTERNSVKIHEIGVRCFCLRLDLLIVARKGVILRNSDWELTHMRTLSASRWGKGRTELVSLNGY